LLGWVFPTLTTSLAPALANVAVPSLVGRVVDQTGTLSSGDVASLNQTLRSFEARKGSQIAVLIVPSTEGEAIEQFSLRVAETWKIGRKKIDDGALLVIAKNDRHLRIEVGYGLEGALTDATTKRIIDEEITPKFKTGDFAGGVSAGINRMIRVIDGEKLPAPEPEHWRSPGLSSYIDPFNPFVIFGVFVVALLLMFATPALLLDGEGPLQSIGTSMRLVLGHLGGILGRVLAFFFLSFVLLLLLTMPTQILSQVSSISGGPTMAIKIATVIWTSALATALFPFGVASLIVLYRALVPRRGGAPGGPVPLDEEFQPATAARVPFE